MGDGLGNLALLVSTVGVNDNENVPVTWQGPKDPILDRRERVCLQRQLYLQHWKFFVL